MKYSRQSREQIATGLIVCIVIGIFVVLGTYVGNALWWIVAQKPETIPILQHMSD